MDLPDVIELHRKLYPESDDYRTIGASATDPAWLAEIPAERPVLIIAEGLLMYLPPIEVERLLRRITDRFHTGELIFDEVAPWVAGLTQRIPERLRKGYPPYLTPIREGRDIERWNPRLRYIEETAVTEQYAKIPNPTVRAVYRTMCTFPALRNWLRVFRAEF